MKPLTGYDIKKLFNYSATYFWPADQAQIELLKLEQGKTVERKVYSITEKGN